MKRNFLKFVITCDEVHLYGHDLETKALIGQVKSNVKTFFYYYEFVFVVQQLVLLQRIFNVFA